MKWLSWVDFRRLRNQSITAFGTHPLLGTRRGWERRKGKEREGGMDFSGDLHAKHWALPKLRGQGAEWLREWDARASPAGLSIWLCPLQLCVLGLCVTILSLFPQ